MAASLLFEVTLLVVFDFPEYILQGIFPLLHNNLCGNVFFVLFFFFEIFRLAFENFFQIRNREEVQSEVKNKD